MPTVDHVLTREVGSQTGPFETRAVDGVSVNMVASQLNGKVRIVAGEVAYHVQGTLVLDPPTGFSATPGDTFVELNWDAVPGVSYSVFYNLGGTFNGATEVSAGETDTTSVVDLTNGIETSFWLVGTSLDGRMSEPVGPITATPSA